jgi:opacity protein-like surface antigen
VKLSGFSRSALVLEFLVLAVILISPAAEANFRKGQLGITGSILAGFPNSDFSDLANTGLGVGLELEYLLTDEISLGLKYDFLPFQGPDLVDSTTLQEEWLTMSYGIIGKYYFDPHNEVVPYFKAGALVSWYDVEIKRGDDDDTGALKIDTSFSQSGRFTAMGGFGMRWDVTPTWGFSGELLFTKIFDVVHELQGTRREIDMQFVSFNLTATLFLGRKR